MESLWEGVDKVVGVGVGCLAYGVSCGELLFCADDCATSLGSVQGTFASDDGLALGRSAVGLAADFGHGVPVVGHCCSGIGGWMGLEMQMDEWRWRIVCLREVPGLCDISILIC